MWLLAAPEVRSLVAESPAGKTEIRRLQPLPLPPPPLRGEETLRPLQILLGGGGGAPPPLPPPRPTEASGASCTSISRQTLSSHKGVFVLFEHLLARTLFPCALCLFLFLLHLIYSKLSTTGLFCSPLSCCGFSLLVALWALRGGSFQFAVRRGALSLPPQDSPPHSTALQVFFFLSKDSPTLCSLGVSTAIGRPQKVGRRDLKGGRQARVRKKGGGDDDVGPSERRCKVGVVAAVVAAAAAVMLAAEDRWWGGIPEHKEEKIRGSVLLSLSLSSAHHTADLRRPLRPPAAAAAAAHAPILRSDVGGARRVRQRRLQQQQAPLVLLRRAAAATHVTN